MDDQITDEQWRVFFGVIAILMPLYRQDNAGAVCWLLDTAERFDADDDVWEFAHMLCD